MAWLGNDLAAYASVVSDDPDDLSITVERRTIDVCNVLQFLGSDGVWDVASFAHGVVQPVGDRCAFARVLRHNFREGRLRRRQVAAHQTLYAAPGTFVTIVPFLFVGLRLMHMHLNHGTWNLYKTTIRADHANIAEHPGGLVSKRLSVVQSEQLEIVRLDVTPHPLPGVQTALAERVAGSWHPTDRFNTHRFRLIKLDMRGSWDDIPYCCISTTTTDISEK